MADIIRLLPDSVANQIAAGEVIQRPSSVVKELVENAIDAKATDIRIIIKDGGRTLIQVIDNGIGMSPTDARMAFERHATSKISGAADLFSLKTMGFRGEALPSICAISQVEVKSRPEEANIGTRLLINASKTELQEAAMCDKGTSIMVKNLFFNVPARRKFLKNDNVEMSNILREFERLALVNHAVRISMEYNQKVIDLRSGTFKQRITDIWKNSLDQQLLPIDIETSLIKISGFVSRPEFARRRNPLQYLIANGRNMKHPYFHKAITSCYDSLISPDSQPCYFLKFEVDPSSIDVNIHPTKNEIKFEFEQEIWSILHAGVKAALGHFGAVPSIDFSIDALPLKPLGKGEKPEQPKLNLDPGYTPFTPDFNMGGGKSYKTPERNFRNNLPHKDWESLYNNFMSPESDAKKTDSPEEAERYPTLPDFNKDENVSDICIQHDHRFIITSSGEKLVIIEQRRAHKKILYEECLRNLKNGRSFSQGLMFPEYVQLDLPQFDIFKMIRPELESIGFKFEKEGDDEQTWKIISVPSILTKIDYSDLIKSIIDRFMEDGEDFGKNQNFSDSILKKFSLEIARKSAIKSRQRLGRDEMEKIVSDLFSLSDPSLGPDGHRIILSVDEEKLDSYFS